MTDSDIKYTLRKFADDTQLRSKIDTKKAGMSSGGLHNFAKWVHENLTKFNKSEGFFSSDLQQLSMISLISCIFWSQKFWTEFVSILVLVLIY